MKEFVEFLGVGFIISVIALIVAYIMLFIAHFGIILGRRYFCKK